MWNQTKQVIRMHQVNQVNPMSLIQSKSLNLRKPKKLSEADFDEDGLISIEDFEEIEAQKLVRNLKLV